MIKILEENKFFIILLKPEGYSVHNQSPSVIEYLKKSSKPVHFVNRLDQETSGLMLIAKSPDYHELLAEALDKGQKFYRALLRGSWEKPEKNLLWSWPITDKAEGRQNPKGISSNRQEAQTKVQVLRTNKFFTEIYIELLTGRQHQIRKHAGIAKHAIVGDARYGDKKYNDNIAKLYSVKRMQLHAEKLVFNFQNKAYTFEAKHSFETYFTSLDKT